MAENNIDGFVGRVYRSQRRETVPYRLFVPPAYDKNQKFPLILWLHGAGGIGVDNRKQFSSGNNLGTHIWTRPEIQAKHHAFVVVPQCPDSVRCWGSYLPAVLEILDLLKSEFSIDSQRIYVAGQSMGGFGTWDMITLKPDLFAAAIPLCGGGNPAHAAGIAQIPIWAFHGAADTNVPVTESRKMISAVQQAGGHPRYTEYKGVGHNVWDRAFKEPELVEWLFAQRK
ncbi:MAG TPA: prolyl oligopeptidase family serine peptidase [Terriglobia bacterium]|nr:prolyl oligopeptidase family serine peptidase [Terriglobia bacterium]